MLSGSLQDLEESNKYGTFLLVVKKCVSKMHFPKIYNFGAPIASAGPGFVFSYSVKSPSIVSKENNIYLNKKIKYGLC